VTCFVKADDIEGKTIVKVGTLDDVKYLDSHKPAQEVYQDDKVKWCPMIASSQ